MTVLKFSSWFIYAIYKLVLYFRLLIQQALGYFSKAITVFFLYLDPKWCSVEKKPYSDKVLSLQWLKGEQDNSFHLFSCGPEGLVFWWTIERIKTSRTFSCDLKAKFCLPYCRQRWPNSAHFLLNDTICTEQNAPLVLLGDRRGSLHLFKANVAKEVRLLAGMAELALLVCLSKGGSVGYVKEYIGKG